jgi:hypothetical protein
VRCFPLREGRAAIELSKQRLADLIDYPVDSFDVMPDGKHVAAVPAGQIRQATHAVFLVNLMDDLRRRLPSKG